MDVEVADADGGEARAEEGEVASCELYHVEPPGGDVGRAGVDLYGIDGQDLTGDGVVEIEVEVVRSGASRFDGHLQRGVVGGDGGGEGPVDCRAARRLVDEHGCDGKDHGCGEHLPAQLAGEWCGCASAHHDDTSPVDPPHTPQPGEADQPYAKRR